MRRHRKPSHKIQDNTTGYSRTAPHHKGAPHRHSVRPEHVGTKQCPDSVCRHKGTLRGLPRHTAPHTPQRPFQLSGTAQSARGTHKLRNRRHIREHAELRAGLAAVVEIEAFPSRLGSRSPCRAGTNGSRSKPRRPAPHLRGCGKRPPLQGSERAYRGYAPSQRP